MDLVGTALRNPINRAILQRLPLLGAPQCWLVAGCIYQAAWNERVGRTPQSDIKDYDIFYFDDSDLAGRRRMPSSSAGACCSRDLDGLIEIRNQARVHLWYPQRFGAPYPQLDQRRRRHRPVPGALHLRRPIAAGRWQPQALCAVRPR